MTFDYHFGGLALTAPLPLEGLRPRTWPAQEGRTVRVTAEAGPPPVPEREHFAWPGRYRLRLGEVDGRWLMQSAFDGSCLIERDGSAIHMICADLPPGQEAMDVLTRRIMPRLPILFGAATIHAASLAGGEGALMLLGPSGAGKSTLSAAMAAQAGWEILSDDMSVLWPGEPAMLAPAATGVCVWPESREGLGLALDPCLSLPGYQGKLQYRPIGGARDTLAPLKGFVFLNRTTACTAPRLDRLTLAEGMTLTVPQLIQFNPSGSGGNERVASLRHLIDAMRTAPAWRLTYPAAFAALPEVVATLRGLLEP